MYWSGMGSLARHDWKTAQYIIVDDVEWQFFKNKKSILGAQPEWTSTEKYAPVRTIKFGRPCIYLCNSDPRSSMDDSEESYFELNVVYYTMGDDDTFIGQ